MTQAIPAVDAAAPAPPAEGDGRPHTDEGLSRQLLEARLLHEATVLAAESGSFEDTLRGCLAIVCRLTGWPVGHAYVPADEDDDGGGELVSSGIWHPEGGGDHAAFRALTEGTRFAPGVGLSGRVWASGEPEWIEDVRGHPGFPRAQACPDLKLTSAFAFPVKVGGRAAAVLEFFTEQAVAADARLLWLVRSIGEQVGRAIERRRAEAALRERSRALEALNRANGAIAAELDLERLVQVVTDAGVELTGAAFGAFFHNVTDGAGGSYLLYTLSGVPREAFARFPMPRNTAVFGPTFRGEGVVRSADITRDPRYGRNPPYHGMPEGHLPVRSYLAAPVVSRSGEVLGGLFFGHPEPGRFTELAERLITGVAAQAAIGIDNARLYRAAQAELAERERVAAALREREARIHLLLDSAAEAIYGLDLDGRCTFCNRACARLLGYDDPAALIGRDMHGLIHHSRPDGSPYPREACEVFRSIREGRGTHDPNEVLWRADGTSFPVERWSYPMHRDGELVGCVVTFLDITERRRAEEQRELLLAELSHRVKNTLAVVRSIARQTGARAASVPSFLGAFEDRLGALATAHALLTESGWQGASLLGLLRAVLGPHLSEDGRVRLRVEDLELRPAAALSLALAFHELATNAGKYGALSVPGGRINLAARVVPTVGGDRDGGGELRLVWREAGGPPARRPERPGFGMTLLTQVVEYQHEGRTRLQWGEGGLVCRLDLPLAEVAGPVG